MKTLADRLRDNPARAGREQCYRCANKIGDAEYVVNDEALVRHYECPAITPERLAEIERAFSFTTGYGMFYDMRDEIERLQRKLAAQGNEA
jgi:hypothetical protein